LEIIHGLLLASQQRLNEASRKQIAHSSLYKYGLL